MSGIINLQFRPRPIDINRPLPIIRGAINEQEGCVRGVPSLPTGMEPEEEEVRCSLSLSLSLPLFHLFIRFFVFFEFVETTICLCLSLSLFVSLFVSFLKRRFSYFGKGDDRSFSFPAFYLFRSSLFPFSQKETTLSCSLSLLLFVSPVSSLSSSSSCPSPLLSPSFCLSSALSFLSPPFKAFPLS